ncbi:MAG: hypothetical protein ACK2UC_13140 [Anaerolineae bacterium]|jgi:flagellar basal body-associated protein FliL
MTTQSEGAPYEGDYEAEPRKGMSGWLIALIIVLVLIVLCCICAFALVLLSGPAVGNVFSTVIETIEAMTPMP